jgi:hypothetical protein
MDDQRFDAIARAVAAATTRRSVLRAIAGAIGGGALVTVGRTHEAAAQTCQPAGEQCGEGFNCCSPNLCDFGGCFGPVLCADSDFGQPGATCTTSDDCCGYLECVEDTCQQDCQFLGEACADSADCCEGTGVGCGKGGTCTLCAGDGGSCAGDGECCDDLTCQSGTCQSPVACAAEGEECAEDADCCDDLLCGDGDLCVASAACAVEGEECEADEDCCDGICCGGACRAVECCVDDLDPNARCPEGTTCFEGVCEESEAGVGATITIHNAECYHGVGDIFGECHDQVLTSVGFSIGGTGVITDGGGVAGATVAAGTVTVAEDAGVFGWYIGAYVYCSEQNSGTVLYDNSADTGAISFAVADGDVVVCDWYNITAVDEY